VPRRDADVDAVLHRVLAQVLPPLPDPDDDVDRALERIDAESAQAPVDHGPDVAVPETVGANRVEDRVPELGRRVRDFHPVDLARVIEPLDAIVETKRRRAAARLVDA